jgi:succinoglycan biosynthesis protein ExoL
VVLRRQHVITIILGGHTSRGMFLIGHPMEDNPNVSGESRTGCSEFRIMMVSGSAHYAPYWKLVSALRDAGATVRVCAFERTWNPGPRLQCDFESLGTLPIRGYFQRFWPLIRSLPRIRAGARDAAVVYALGFDMSLLSILALTGIRKKPRIVYEVHDIRNVLVGDGIVSRLIRLVDRFLVRSSDLLVVTSKAYVTYYYAGRLGLERVRTFLLENKLDPAHTPAPQADPFPSPLPLRIGYFGSLRCPITWEVLVELARRAHGRAEVYLRGVPNNLPGFEAQVSQLPGLTYEGPYVNPDDLPTIYKSIDLMWVAGFNAKRSGGWSRTCRFYESCYFGKPMIGQIGTEDGDAVARFGIGLTVDATRVRETVDQILAISKEDIHRWQNRMADLPLSVYAYTNDHQRLLTELRAISSSAGSAVGP